MHHDRSPLLFIQKTIFNFATAAIFFSNNFEIEVGGGQLNDNFQEKKEGVFQ